MRALYEPEAIALSTYLRMPLPQWTSEPREKDQWRVLTKLRNEAEAISGRGASAFLHDDHGH